MHMYHQRYHLSQTSRGVILLLLTLGFAAATVYAETAPQHYWTHQFGATSGSSALDAALAVDSDGAAYMVGAVDGTLPDETGSGARDIFIRKYSHAGEVVWTHQLGTVGVDTSYAVTVSNGAVYITGLVDGTLPGEVSMGATDAFIRAYTLDGTLLWNHQFGTAGNDVGAGILSIESGPYAGIYVGGTTNGTFDGQTNQGGSDIFLTKFDESGTYATTTQYGTAADDELTALTGNTSGIFAIGYMEPGGFLSSFDEEGHVMWTEHYGIDANITFGIEPTGISLVGSSIYISGGIVGSLEDTSELGSDDAFLLKYDTLGTPVWQRQFGTNAADKANAVSTYATSSDTGLLLVAGNTVGTFQGATSTGATDAFVQAFNPDGTTAWVHQFGTDGSDTLQGISAALDHAFVVGRTDGIFPGEITTGGLDAFMTHLTWSNDSDNDHILNEVDIYPFYPSTEFADEISGGTSYGVVNLSNDQTVHVTDAPLVEDGIDITIDSSGGLAPALVSVCDPSTTFNLTPNDEIIVTCASVHTRVENGEVEALFRAADGSEIQGTLPEDTQLSFDQDENTFIADPGNPETINLTVGSSTYSIDPGDTLVISTDVQGPTATNTLVVQNPLPVDSPFTVTATLTEVGSSSIAYVYLSIDGSATTSMSAVDGTLDEINETVILSLPAYTTAGVHNVCVWGVDSTGNSGVGECIFLAVYDPDGGFVTGSGKMQSPLGAYVLDPSLTGKVEFGFVSKYKRHVSLPQGETEFKFKSDQYDWLVVNGPRAQYRGTGTINESGNYGFTLTAIDEARPGGGTVDRLRMKIWDKNNGNAIVYDNKLGAPDTDDPVTAIQGGNIIIHH